MKRILILSLAVAPLMAVGCSRDHREEQNVPAVEEVSPTTTTPATPPPAVMPPETTMVQPESVPGATNTPGQAAPLDTAGIR